MPPKDLEKYSRSFDETWHVFSTSLALTDWVYGVPIMTLPDVTMTSQNSHFEF